MLIKMISKSDAIQNDIENQRWEGVVEKVSVLMAALRC